MHFMNIVVSSAVAVSAVMSSAVVPMDKRTVNADVAQIKRVFSHPAIFCTWFQQGSRSRSPLNVMSLDRVKKACKKISPGVKKVANPRKNNKPRSGMKCAAMKTLLKAKTRQPVAFCNFWTSVPSTNKWRFTSPFPNDFPNVLDVYSACTCVPASDLPTVASSTTTVSTTSAVETTSAAETTPAISTTSDGFIIGPIGASTTSTSDVASSTDSSSSAAETTSSFIDLPILFTTTASSDFASTTDSSSVFASTSVIDLLTTSLDLLPTTTFEVPLTTVISSTTVDITTSEVPLTTVISSTTVDITTSEAPLTTVISSTTVDITTTAAPSTTSDVSSTLLTTTSVVPT